MPHDPAAGSGRDHYHGLFERRIEDEAEWLRRGAPLKVDSIEQLLRSVPAVPGTVMELGAGTGAVIEEIRRRGIGQRHIAVDFSSTALAYLAHRSPDIQTIAGDLLDPDLQLPQADLVVLSHVLEHLENPLALLRSVRSLDFTHLAIEVPLEDLLVSRLRAGVRDRARNAAGHVQFFQGPDVDRLAKAAGLEIIARRRYAPVLDADSIRFVAYKNQVSAARRSFQTMTGHLFPRFLAPIWRRLYYAHYAVLCRSMIPVARGG